MRLTFAAICSILILALAGCAIVAWHTHKRMGKPVALLEIALLPPVLGNTIIIISGNLPLTLVGCYTYYLGMDFVMFAMLGFAFNYCRISWPSRILQVVVYGLLILDVVQLLMNPFFGHAFANEGIVVDGYYYYRMIPLLGQTFHRIVDYGIFLSVLIIFCYKVVTAPKIYSERYYMLLGVMVFAGLWQSFYIFSGSPIDRSMIGFAVFGLLVFYFAIFYRPMRLLDRMLASIASEMPEALFFFDAVDRCIWANEPGQKLLKIGEEELDLVEPRLLEQFGSFALKKGDWSLQHVNGEGDAARYFMLEGHEVQDNRGRQAGSFLSIRDNTEDQMALVRERHAANHDVLTGLYTKEHLYEEIQKLLWSNPEKDYIVLFANVNDFKIVNDIFGSDFGDYALQQIADLIREFAPAGCVYGRIGGDTFGGCLPVENYHPEMVDDILKNYVVTDGNVEHQVVIHVGGYRVTESDMDVSLMFDRARLALTTIKDSLQKHVVVYTDEMRESVLWNQNISMQLAGAIQQRQIVPYLQPMVDSTGKVVGAEALVRWIHPEYGFLPPYKFIPVFEENGMIAEVDKYMWRCACEILSRWKKEGKNMFLSVNISPKDFYFMDVAAEIRNIVKEYDIVPSQLRLEITETVMMTDMENRVRILNQLKGDGFMVEMDDFGSGYSSLNMLKDMPVDLIKVDMMFLEKSSNNDRARVILNSIMSLSKELGISTLTEGVETLEQFQMLTGMGCGLFQGYYFSKPIPLQDFEDFCA